MMVVVKRLFLVLVFASIAVTGFSNSADSLMRVLVDEIANRDTYVKVKTDRIRKLTREYSQKKRLSLNERFDIYNTLYHEYKTFIYDSAFNYAGKLIETAYRLNDKPRIGYARVKMSFILLNSGMFKETFDTLNTIDVKSLHDSTRTDYYRILGRAYSDLNVYNKDEHYRKYYTTLNGVYNDSAYLTSAKGSYYHYYLAGVKHLHDRQYETVISLAEKMLREIKVTNPQRAVSFYDVATAYRFMGNNDKAIEFFIQSSLADIRAATKETAAMYTLARMLYEKGDVANAYICIKQAVDDAEFYGARQRKVEIGSILPVIANAALNNSETQRKKWLAYGIGISFLTIVSVMFGVIIFKQLKKLKAAEGRIIEANNRLQESNNKLSEANKIKEEYIGYYFSVNSEYVDKLETLKKSIEQKLVNKKFEDIKYIVNNINAKKDRDELYFSFDKVFLKLFPDFIKDFNSYFKNEDQFVLKDGQLLTTELRIFALIRMGITDTEDIARILDYSVNTIYAYKTRIRNKSILPNDEFDQKIMEIKTA